VFGALERGGKVRAAVVETRKKAGLHACVREHVEVGAALYYAHNVIDHAEKYIDGRVHTNGLENSGACSSAASLELTLVSSHSICFATLMSKCSATTIARLKTIHSLMQTASTWLSANRREARYLRRVDWQTQLTKDYEVQAPESREADEEAFARFFLARFF
jgi:hypothetical protein